MRTQVKAIAATLGAVVCVGACIAVPEGAGIPQKLQDQGDASADSFISVDASTTQDVSYDLPMADPHLIIGISPSHGAFTGDYRALIRGNGFSSNVRVWIGATELAPKNVIAPDPTRIQVIVPPGPPGQVDVQVQNGTDESTRRILKASFHYDAFYLKPSEGPTSGGTRISLRAMDLGLDSSSEVKIGGKACTDLKVASDAQLECTTSAHTQGAVRVDLSTGGKSLSVEDAFVYADSDNGFKGGLSGNPLNGSLRVLVFDAYTGNPVVKALAVAGDSIESSIRIKTDITGLAMFQDLSLSGKRSVTITKKCYQPVTFVDVPVSTVTAYLSPIMSPECGGDGGDIPPTGGRSSNPALVMGELIWSGGIEFQKAAWTNVPKAQGPDERQAAYIFSPAYDGAEAFRLPDVSQAITGESDGVNGYAFQYSAGGGNLTLYALAGIENRKANPPTFTAYSFGMVRGVKASPGEVVSEIFIPMETTLDQAVTLRVIPPKPGAKGPDRMVAGVGVELGQDGFAIFPNMQKSLPIGQTSEVPFVGLPGLTGVLSKNRFVSSARAVTGANQGMPLSIVGKRTSIDASVVVPIDGFVQVPQLVVPSATGVFDGRHVEIAYAPGGASIDVNVVGLQAASGLVEWTVVSPGNKTSIELPDLAELGEGIPSGPITLVISGGHIDDAGFDYGTLLYRHMSTRGWTAYSQDNFHAFY